MALAKAGKIARGLSPRVRGNQDLAGGAVDAERSIPARAGEPASTGTSTPTSRVYPRACGGTDDFAPRTGTLTGLSPRVRGNPL